MKSELMREHADEALKRCVTKKGYPIIAQIMYIGVRAEAFLRGGY